MSGDRLLAFSDIHGQASRFREALASSGYNPDRDRLIGLGDYIDRGPESRQCVAEVRGLARQGALFLSGNHEALLWNYVQDPLRLHFYLFDNYGGAATLASYGASSPHQSISQELAGDVAWFESLPTHLQIGDYYFVHAGVDVEYPLRKQTQASALWISDPWVFSARPHPYEGITVVHGHTMTFRWVPNFLQMIGDQERLAAWASERGGVFREPDRICIDTGAATGELPVTIYDISNDKVYQA